MASGGLLGVSDDYLYLVAMAPMASWVAEMNLWRTPQIDQTSVWRAERKSRLFPEMSPFDFGGLFVCLFAPLVGFDPRLLPGTRIFYV